MKIGNIKINSNLKTIISIMIYIFFFIFVLYFFLIGSIKEIKKTSLDIMDKKSKTEFYFESMKSNQDFGKKMEILDYKLIIIENSFIGIDKQVDFIRAMEDLATKYNIKQNISIDSIALNSVEKYKKVPMDLAISGNFGDVMNYISAIESLNYYINIKFINLSAGSISTDFSDPQAPQKKGISGIIKTDTYWK